MNDALVQKWVDIVGERYALRNTTDIAPFIEDTRGRWNGTSSLVLRPANVDEVSRIMRLAHETSTPVIPQGGNTGLVGGGLPLVNGSKGDEIILSLGRMNKIVEVDADTNTMTVEAGTLLETIQKAADQADRLFPLSLGSQGTCQIGGNVSSNAGGTAVLAYGNTRELVMGLEAVLPNGDVWNGLSKLRKDNTGYDLKNLMVGAEGTLGIITKAVLKLFNKPRGREVAYAALSSPAQALELLNRAKATAGNGLTGFEFMAEMAMDFTLKHTIGARRPVAAPAPWYILMEISSGRSAQDARAMMENILEEAFEADLLVDASIAQSSAQQDAFWKLREDMSWAQKPEGASIKHDIAVPVGLVPIFIEQANKAVLDLVAEARIVNFGHMGDGNLHYNISQPVGWSKEQFFAFEDRIHNRVYDIVLSMGGSISAEHGIGQMKRDKLAQIKDPIALKMMHTIKQALDPKGIMNPGKVLAQK